ncbi:ligand-gated channel protein [Sodalis sp. TME1]|nr:ligand-gated channel protein [Sodalis sp. TME1]
MRNRVTSRAMLLSMATLTPSLAGAAQSDSTTDTVVVTAAGFQQKIEDSAASISVISRETLENKAYIDVTDALKDVPGVVVTGGGSRSDISIRGMAAKYTLILVDGKRVDTRGTRPNSDGPGIEQGWLPPLAAIERIEVVRGPMSSLYGSDAMGGVINIITRKVGKSWQTSVRSEAVWQEDRRSGDIYQSNLYTAGPLIDGLLGVKLNGLLSRRGEDRIIEGYNGQRMKSGGVTFTLTPDDANSFDLDLGHFVQDRNGSPGKSLSAGNPPSDGRYTRNNYALTHSGNYDGGMTTSYLQREETRNPSRKMETANTLLNTQNAFYLGNHTLSVGGQYRYETLKDQGNQLSSARSLNELNRWSWALSAEDEWLMTQDFALTTGLRINRDENYGSHWTPRLYGVWHLTETWTLKGGVSGGYRSPELRQAVAEWGQITGGGGTPAIIIGNPNLKPEKSLNQEIALLWDNRRYLNAGVTVFNTDYRDKITEVRSCTDLSGTASGACTIGGTNYKFISHRVNVDKARVRGVEANFNWTITPAWSLASSYTFTETEQRSGEFSGKPLNEMPKHMINATLNWQTTPDIASWLRVNHRGQSSAYLSRTSMSEGRPSYTFVDVGASWRVMKQLQLQAGVYNLLDKRVDYVTYGRVLDGRRYLLGANIDF